MKKIHTLAEPIVTIVAIICKKKVFTGSCIILVQQDICNRKKSIFSVTVQLLVCEVCIQFLVY